MFKILEIKGSPAQKALQIQAYWSTRKRQVFPNYFFLVIWQLCHLFFLFQFSLLRKLSFWPLLITIHLSKLFALPLSLSLSWFSRAMILLCSTAKGYIHNQLAHLTSLGVAKKYVHSMKQNDTSSSNRGWKFKIGSFKSFLWNKEMGTFYLVVAKL